MNEILKKRLKSFAWRTAMLMLALFLAELAYEINLVDIPDIYRLLIGLLAGELSKYLNNKYQGHI
jgi:hypothetical protein